MWSRSRRVYCLRKQVLGTLDVNDRFAAAHAGAHQARTLDIQLEIISWRSGDLQDICAAGCSRYHHRVVDVLDLRSDVGECAG